jgi:hypothetical protein
MLEATFYNSNKQPYTQTIIKAEKQYQAQQNTLYLNLYCDAASSNFDGLYNYFKNQTNDAYIVEISNDTELLYTNRDLTLALIDHSYMYQDEQLLADMRIELIQEDAQKEQDSVFEN